LARTIFTAVRRDRGVDTEIALDMLRMFAMVAERRQNPDDMGYGDRHSF